MYRLIIVLFLYLVSACTSTVDKEIPVKPQEKSIASTTTNNKSKLSRYGNPAKYRVSGKTYRVLNTSKDFHQIGIASWYGPNFHKKRTSSGEVYDMYEMTAAHKTLPLPSFLKVKNLNNNKEIIVKVNDRGPFHSDRILDLSFAAAKELGILHKGTGRVEISNITSNNQPENSSFYLQVGAFNQRKNAQILVDKLKASLENDAVTVITAKKSYLVQVGPIANLDKSNQYQQKLIELGYHQTFSLLK